jgi:acyl carrier protein
MRNQQSIKFNTALEIREWLTTYMVEELNLNKHEIDSKAHFSDFGLDSSTAVILTGDLSEWLGYDLEPTLLLDYPTLETLVKYLSNQ